MAITSTVATTCVNQRLLMVCPRIAIHQKHGKTATESRHNKTPPTFALIALGKSAFMVCAQEVVMPHPGHRIPTHVNRLQPGNPSCVCVPIPDASGFNHAAIAKSRNRKKPREKKTTRSRRLYRRPFWWVWISWLVDCSIGPIACFENLILQPNFDSAIQF